VTHAGPYLLTKGLSALGDINLSLVVIHAKDAVRFYVKGCNPQSRRYLGYQLLHCRDQLRQDCNKHHDLWRMHEIWEVERTDAYAFRPVRAVANGGEWECAIRQVGKGDFMGGRIHGKEFLSEVNFSVDGTARSLDDVGEYQAQVLELRQLSTLAEHDTQNRVVVAEKETHWHITTTVMTLTQRITWFKTLQLNDAYLCMLPIKRLHTQASTDAPDGLPGTEYITDTGARAPDWQPEDLSQEGFTPVYSQSHHARAWSEASGIYADVEVVEGWNLPKREFNFSPAPQYNKLYFDFCGEHTVHAGDEWRTKSRYRITTKA
jgi:hypothetical protein